MRPSAIFLHAHIFALCGAYRRGVNSHFRQTADIHPEMIGRGAFIVKHIYPADRAEIMLRDTRVPLIERKRPLARRDCQIRLGHFHHNRPAHRAERAVASRELREVRDDLELNSAAMAFGVVGWHNLISKILLYCKDTLSRLHFRVKLPNSTK